MNRSYGRKVLILTLSIAVAALLASPTSIGQRNAAAAALSDTPAEAAGPSPAPSPTAPLVPGASTPPVVSQPPILQPPQPRP
ncbi:MAG: hypothetical protein ACR2PL_08840, partial [Dehalococcoidia bacterium]